MSDITAEQIFEVVGVYFANTYWNHLHKSAIDEWSEEKFATKEEAFKTTAERYSRAFCAPNDKTERINKHYLAILKDLHNNYKTYLETSDTLLGFIDTLSRFLLPKEYYKTLARQDPRKDNIIRKILTKTVARFTIFVTQQEAKKAVDDKERKNTRNVEHWKKKIIDLLVQERNEFCSLLLAKNSGVDIKNRDEIPSIPKEVCDKLQSRIKDLITEKSEITQERNKLVKYIGVLKKMVRDKDILISELQQQLGVEDDNVSEISDVSETSVQPKSRSRPRTSGRGSRRTRTVKQTSSKDETSKETTSEKKHEKKEEVDEKNEALEELENQEYDGEDFVDNSRPRHVEMIELPDDELEADE